MHVHVHVMHMCMCAHHRVLVYTFTHVGPLHIRALVVLCVSCVLHAMCALLVPSIHAALHTPKESNQRRAMSSAPHTVPHMHRTLTVP